MKKILIIEDDELIAGIYRGQLEREGYAVELSHDGELGLARIIEWKPDGVLLDLMLPKISGVEILQRIRARDEFQQIPVVVFSNSFVPNLFQRAREAGASKVFNKASARPSEMVAAMKALCPSGASPAVPAGTILPSRKPASTTSGRAATEREEAETAFVFQSGLRSKFLAETPERLAAFRKLFQDAVKTEAAANLPGKLMELGRVVHGMTGQAGIAGLNRTAQISSALEALLKELHDKPKYINPSSLRTVAQTLDFLEVLIRGAEEHETDAFQPSLILAVDDDVISRQALRSALDKANLKSITVESPDLALTLGKENRFDLVLSDVEMPGMNGFQLCQKLRALPGNEKTPFIFVTSLTDFEARTRSILIGGNDLIGKPFLLIELAVKALSHVLKNQLGSATPP